MIKIAAMGDNTVDCYLDRMEMFPGGSCVNVAAISGRFGYGAAYIGVVGKDEAGDLIANALLANNVDVSRLRRVDGETAYCNIGIKNGERHFLAYDLGVSVFEPNSVELAALEEFDGVHVSQSSGLDAYLSVIAASTKLSYDFSYRRDPQHRLGIAPLCYLASISASDLSENEIENLATDVLARGTTWVLATRGNKGAALFGKDERYTTRAVEIDVVDTLGAGDTFIARTFCGLLSGEPPQSVLEAAAAAAAETCQIYGAFGHPAPLEVGMDISELKGLEGYVGQTRFRSRA